MIIVGGKIIVRHGARDEFIGLSAHAVVRARRTEGCRDFAVSPDPVDANRVNVYEVWTSRSALFAFRGDGPEERMASLIERAEVSKFEALPERPAHEGPS